MGGAAGNTEQDVQRSTLNAQPSTISYQPSTRTALQRRDADRRKDRIRLWEDTRNELRAALTEILPGTKVYVFGSLTRPGVFNARSDIDLALLKEFKDLSVYGLAATLEERLGRPVDIVLLSRCRFAAKILREGELWMS